MATPCTITAQMSDGKFRSIYCHYDGNIEHVGKILAENYTSQDKIESLIALGNLASLGETTDSHPNHSFANPIAGYCGAYVRDAGEPNTASTKGYDTHREALDGLNYKHKNKIYIKYLWDGDQWMVNGQNLDEALTERAVIHNLPSM
jgi:hypothetical protein